MSPVKRTMAELGRLSPEAFREAPKIPVVLVLDNIRSGLNVGSLFRSADAFRIEAIYCCGYTPAPPHREVLKTALGATEAVHWEQHSSAAEAVRLLRERGYTALAVEQAVGSISLQEWEPGGQPVALVLGNEVSGVSDEVLSVCDGALEVTQWGTKHSLNVAVCGGIVLYHVRLAGEWRS